jgi:hypothetical protein
MTQTFMEPTIDVPIELVDPAAECTAGYAWCIGECTPEDPFHWSGHRWILALSSVGRSWVRDDFSIHLRIDEGETNATPLILISDGLVGFTAEQARATAAELLNAADELDPLPTGAMVTTAVDVRIGDELLTTDGWQKVVGLALFSDTEQASIFTPEQGGDMDGSDGWDLSFSDPVKVRRPVHGSCAITFVEPIR